MKRFLTILLCLAACLSLAGCRRYLPENSGHEPENMPVAPIEPEPPAPLRFDTLNVEFSTGARDVNDLLALYGTFPDALRRALTAQGIEVGDVAVTFGSSGEATELALQNGAVQLAFLAAEDYYPYRSGMIAAVQHAADPELSLGLVVCAVSDDAAADDRFASAVRAALPELAEVLAPYTGEEADGRYTFDAELLEQLSRLYRTGDAVLCTDTASAGGRELSLRGVGHRLNEYLWGINAIEVVDGAQTLQTIEMSEAADDPEGGLEAYTSCPETALLLRAVDVNFDGHEDVEVFGWTTNNTAPYFYWLWDPDAQKYAYGFRLQGPTIDAASRTLTAEYRESAAVSWRDTYEWQNGELIRTEHLQTTE